MKKIKLQKNKNGFAAIVTLWIIVLVVAILAGYAYNLIEELKLTNVQKYEVLSEFNAINAFNKALAYISNNRQNKPTATDLIITEVRVSTNKAEEYIEIYNPTDEIKNVTDYTIRITIAGTNYDRAISDWNSVTSAGSSKPYHITNSTNLNPGAYAVILPFDYKDTVIYDSFIPPASLILALNGDGAGSWLGSTPSGFGNASKDSETTVALRKSGSTISSITLNPGGGALNTNAAYEQTNFRDDGASFEECDAANLSGAAFIKITGTPGALNTTVKFSTDKTSNLPYILPRASWMSGASAVEFDEDGDTKFVWWATPSTAKFNVNHNLLSGSAAVSNEGDSAIDNYIFYYFTPDSLRSPVAKDILKYKSLYDTGATPLPIYGKRYRFADEFFLVSGVGMGVYRTSAPSVFNIIELSASYHPLNIGNWRIYPYIINHSNKETVIGNAGIISAKPTPFGINNPYGSPGEAKTYADLIANALYDGRITNNTNLYDGVGAGLTTRHGALYEFLKTINDMNYSNFSSDPDRGNWLKDFFMLNSIGGLHSIPVAFGPTYALGKYMYWEINIEGYANWQGSGADRRPKRIKRLRAEVAVPIYKNQPAPDNKIKVIFWAEDWSSGKWRISNY